MSKSRDGKRPKYISLCDQSESLIGQEDVEESKEKDGLISKKSVQMQYNSGLKKTDMLESNLKRKRLYSNRAKSKSKFY